MSIWLVEPLDPLIARDGRPAAVGRFDTVGFPFPSMVAGAVRTRMGSPGGAFVIPRGALEELKEKVPVQGPLLAEIAELGAEGGEVQEWLAPVPKDAAYLREEVGKEKEKTERTVLRRLAPRSLGPGEAMDSLSEKGLLPVAMQPHPPGPPLPSPSLPPGEGGNAISAGILNTKPPADVPAFWAWSDFAAWLTAPADSTEEHPAPVGIDRLPVERRAHLAVQPGERVGIDGMLFETAGLRFLQEGATPLTPRRFALSLRCAEASVAGQALALRRQIAPLGGERRLARWSLAGKEWPELPEAVRAAIVATRRARLILLTPAIFRHGALPGWSGGPWPLGKSSGGGVQATVRAACVARPDVVSGWDLAKGRAKKSRRMAAAGSVYFLTLDGGSADDLQAWCDAAWLACVSDDWEERRDGFGLAALGTWEDAR